MNDVLDSKHWHKVTYTVSERKVDFDNPVLFNDSSVRPEFRELPRLVAGTRPPKSVCTFDNIKQLFGGG